MGIKHIDYSKKSDKTYWDELAENGNTYQHGMTNHRQKVIDFIEKYNISSLLDVGCGTGPMFELVKPYILSGYIAYKGVDYSEGFIKIAKKTFGDQYFRVADARRLPFRDNSYDFVLIMHTLDHIDDWKKAIAEAKRISRRNIMIVLWRSFTKERDWAHQTVMNDTLYKDTYLREFNQAELEQELAKQQLSTVDKGEVINDDGHYNYYYYLLI